MFTDYYSTVHRTLRHNSIQSTISLRRQTVGFCCCFSDPERFTCGFSEMENMHKSLLTNNMTKFISDLDLSVLPFLEEKSILNESDVGEIRRLTEHRGREELLKIIKKKEPAAFDIFCQALVQVGQPHLARLLDPTCLPEAPVVPSEFADAIEDLKDIYWKKCEFIKEQWDNLMGFEMDKMFLDLDIRKKTGQNAEESLNRDQEYNELFGYIDGKRRYSKIVLEGNPGMGKSTYLHRLVQKWAIKKDPWLTKEFDLIILVRLGDVQPGQDLAGYLSHELPPEHVASMTKFIKAAQIQKRTLLVLDAFDEMGHNQYFTDLIARQQIDSKRVLFTLLISTRTSHSAAEALKGPDLLLRTYGFDPKAEDGIRQEIKQLKHIDTSTIPEGSQEFSLYKNPLFAGMLRSLGDAPTPKELFHLMQEFCLKVIDRYYQKPQDGQKIQKPPGIVDQIQKFLGKFAFISLPHIVKMRSEKTKELLARIFSDEINDRRALVKLCCDVGLLWPPSRSSCSVDQQPYAEILMYSFPHQLFGEYFVAYFANKVDMMEKLEDDEIFNIQSPVSYFLSGLSSQWKCRVLQICFRAGVFRCPWIYDPEKLPDRDYWWNPDTHPNAVGSLGYNLNHGILLQVLASKCPQYFSKILFFVALCFDENSTSILKHISTSGNLIFQNCQLHKSGVDAFEEWIEDQRFHGYKSMDVSSCDFNLTEKVVKLIARQSALESLQLSHLDEKLTVLLAETLQSRKDWEPLHSFILTHTAISKASSVLFSSLSASLQGLEFISLKMCEEAVEGFTKYLETRANSSLRGLGIHGCQIPTYVTIFQSLPKTLEILDAGCGNLQSEDVSALIGYLRAETTTLRKLDVSWNPVIGSMPEFAKALCNPTLCQVGLKHCCLGQQFVKRFLDTIDTRGKKFDKVKITKKDSKDVSDEQWKQLSELGVEFLY